MLKFDGILPLKERGNLSLNLMKAQFYLVNLKIRNTLNLR